MKFILLSILVLALSFNFILSETPAPAPLAAGAEPPVVFKNPYIDDRKAKHSLFREKDSLERLSMEAVGIPRPKDKYYKI